VPVLTLVAGQWLDDFGAYDQFLLDYKNTGIILMNVRVVGARRQCHQVVRETLNSFWANRVGTDHHR
jgi:hypothetical protein